MRFGVKICGLSTPETVDVAVDAGADAIGLVLTPSPRQVDHDTARRLLQRIPREVVRVAVVRGPDAAVIASLGALSFDVVQADDADVPALQPLGMPILRAFHDGPDLLDRLAAARAGGGALWGGGFLVDGPGGGGTGVRADIGRAAAAAHRGGMVLAGGLDPENIGEIVRFVQPAGVDVSTGVESSRGVKDKVRIRAFVQAVRAEQHRSVE